MVQWVTRGENATHHQAFTVGGKRAPLEAPFQPRSWALSTSVCILLGTSQSGNVRARSRQYLRGLGRYPLIRDDLAWLLPP